jgi:phosphoribosyl-ATP pyrophosphohydrolase
VSDILTQLAEVIEARRHAPATESYVASLCAGGIDRVLKKIGEEATETILAAKSGERAQIVHETADLWFHLVVLLTLLDIEPAEVLGELERRFGRSGLAEKAARGGQPD